MTVVLVLSVATLGIAKIGFATSKSDAALEQELRYSNAMDTALAAGLDSVRSNGNACPGDSSTSGEGFTQSEESTPDAPFTQSEQAPPAQPFTQSDRFTQSDQFTQPVEPGSPAQPEQPASPEQPQTTEQSPSTGQSTASWPLTLDNVDGLAAPEARIEPIKVMLECTTADEQLLLSATRMMECPGGNVAPTSRLTLTLRKTAVGEADMSSLQLVSRSVTEEPTGCATQ